MPYEQQHCGEFREPDNLHARRAKGGLGRAGYCGVIGSRQKSSDLDVCYNEVTGFLSTASILQNNVA